MNYEVIVASIKKTIIGRKTKSLIAALLFAFGYSFGQTTISDIDGNTYNTVTIGSQIWMKENLKVTKYNNGTNIITGLSNNSWINNTSGAYMNYNNDTTLVSIYGRLYNWYAISNPSGLCPVGWHVPNNSDWNLLIKTLDSTADTICIGCNASNYAGGALKETGILHWQSPNSGANNSSGFTALPGGNWNNQYNGYYGYWWSSTEQNSTNAINYDLSYNNSNISRVSNTKYNGLSIRCISNLSYNNCTGNIAPDGPTTFCAGNYVNLTSDVVGGTYQWKKNGVNISTNGTSRTYKATATGSYTCVATCNGTALTSNAIQVTTKTNAFASVTASGATSFCAGDSVTLNCTNLGSNYSVQWYRTNISMENATNYSQVVKQPGTYKVVTKNLTTGCSRISGSAITTSVNCRIAGDITSGTNTEEQSTNEARFTANDLSQGVNVFPNPNNGTFSFTYDGEETGDGILQIMNSLGQTIYTNSVRIPEGGFVQDIALGDQYNKGIYIVRLLINGSYHDSRVMVR